MDIVMGRHLLLFLLVIVSVTDGLALKLSWSSPGNLMSDYDVAEDAGSRGQLPPGNDQQELANLEHPPSDPNQAAQNSDGDQTKREMASLNLILEETASSPQSQDGGGVKSRCSYPFRCGVPLHENLTYVDSWYEDYSTNDTTEHDVTEENTTGYYLTDDNSTGYYLTEDNSTGYYLTEDDNSTDLSTEDEPEYDQYGLEESSSTFGCISKNVQKEIYGNECSNRCGISPITNTSHLPFLAMLWMMYEEYITCEGALITNRHILTTRTCLYKDGILPSELWVFTGTRLDEKCAHFELNIGEHIYLHAGADDARNHDIAILKLTDAVLFSQAVQPVYLPVDESLCQDYNLYENEDAIVSGFPVWDWDVSCPTISAESARVLSSASQTCQKWNQFWPGSFNTSTKLCASSSYEMCESNGGNPLVILKEERFVLIGIQTSVGNCYSQLPQLYTRITSYVSWINTVLKGQYCHDITLPEEKVESGGDNAGATLASLVATMILLIA